MGEPGVIETVIERCLNHVEQNRMKQIYQRQEADKIVIFGKRTAR